MSLDSLLLNIIVGGSISTSLDTVNHSTKDKNSGYLTGESTPLSTLPGVAIGAGLYYSGVTLNIPEPIMMGIAGITAEIWFTYFTRNENEDKGYSYPIMFPIYASAAYGLDLGYGSIEDMSWYAKGSIMGAGVMGGEWAFGKILQKGFGCSPWEDKYAGKWDTFDDQVRLSYFPGWVAFSVGLLEPLHRISKGKNVIDNYIRGIDKIVNSGTDTLIRAVDYMGSIINSVSNLF